VASDGRVTVAGTGNTVGLVDVRFTTWPVSSLALEIVMVPVVCWPEMTESGLNVRLVTVTVGRVFGAVAIPVKVSAYVPPCGIQLMAAVPPADPTLLALNCTLMFSDWPGPITGTGTPEVDQSPPMVKLVTARSSVPLLVSVTILVTETPCGVVPKSMLPPLGTGVPLTETPSAAVAGTARHVSESVYGPVCPAA